MPLLTLPYLVRVLGPDYFGLIAFATSAIAYFVLITDYGFNLSATRQISIHRNNKDKVNEIFSSVMIIKAVLMMMSFLVMILFVFGFDKFREDWSVYFISFGAVVGQVLFPVWLFQGMEQLKYIAYLNLGTKILLTVCIFGFVKTQEDYLLVPIMTALSHIGAGVWSLILVKHTLNVSFVRRKIKDLRIQLAEGWHVFLSTVAVSLYTISTTFILGLFSSNAIVGYFAAAEKVVQACKGVYTPVSQAVYPLISSMLSKDKRRGLNFLRQLTWIAGSGMFGVSCLLLLYAEPLVTLLLGGQFTQSTLLIQVMAFLPFIVSLSNICGIQTMLNLGYKKEFSFFVVIAATVGVGLSLLLAPAYHAVGVAVAVLLAELTVTLLLGRFVLIRAKKGVL